MTTTTQTGVDLTPVSAPQSTWRIPRKDLIVGLIATLAAVFITRYGDHPFRAGWLELFGCVTGAWAVWLVARANMWTWPIGIVNAAFFVILFYQYRLYGDAAINVFYVVAGAWGWYHWMHGGVNKTERKIGNVPIKEAVGLAIFWILATLGIRELLILTNGAAPWLDSMTTALSMVAFYMQGRKYWASWLIWILADCIYIPLYFSRDLALTGLLYVVFMIMCFVGLFEWRRQMLADRYTETKEEINA